ncbi:discoidin domain-containing protein [Allorhizocola rhizosphaerae]|uniref:discoidin domain-containing protein n=1 Tax=Allorhizocola rhizosphaerae TaxID=1872709 RepID=UPI0013C3574C|nr:discoidin domain-containing protein [Allorhizocola rhizosphaerae]
MAILLSMGAQAGASPATIENLQAWHETIAGVPHPSAKGCFTATYPRLVWRETKCAAPPTTPMTPKPPGPTPLVIGSGNSISAQTPAGPIFQAFGSFENVSGVTSVSSPITPGGPAVANAYTLQLNTNYFKTPACAGAAFPDLCGGFTQFVFANNGTSGLVYIEYWLLSYNTTCPAAFAPVILGGDTFCRQATPAATVSTNTPITSMANFLLSGDISGATDRVTMSIGGTAYSSTGTSIVDPGAEWIMAEFNVFGYGNGHMATFNSTAAAHVRTRINYGGTAPPICVAQGFTSETNSLNFALPRPPSTPGTPPQLPAVIMHQNNSGGAPTNCDAAEVWGDTHQITFAGTNYDFQATGDFVEALIEPTAVPQPAPAAAAPAQTLFEVQTRKVSGAPNWPNTSVNKSAGVRMGNTRVAVCDGTRLVVNGTTTTLDPDRSMWLSAGVDIHRRGSNVWIVRDKSGNSVRIQANSGYTDVKVGLGTWPVRVRGLLGNPNNNPNLLEARDGTQFAIPISFSDLYNRYGASWRANPLNSLLQPCNTVATGNPSGPFFTGHLAPQVREQAEAICRQTGVPAAWLDTCTLDAAVVGAHAAPAFVGMEPPVVDANPNDNLARAATASASSTYSGYSPARVNDGARDTRLGPTYSWANNAGTYPPNNPEWVRLDFGAAKTFRRVVVYTSEGYPIRDFDIQVLSGGTWVTPAGGAVRGNTQLSRTINFATAQSSQFVRVLGMRGPTHQDGYVRVNEFEVYPQ